MTEVLLCLDTSVLIKFLTEEPPGEHVRAATDLVRRGLLGDAELVAPAFAWAEVGSVLRKKVRQGLIGAPDASDHWADFLRLPIRFVETAELRERAWQIAASYDLSTLYDAVFLACAELAPGSERAIREFWTADQSLLRHFSHDRPAYVRELA